LPAWLQERFEQNLANNSERWRRLKVEYRRVGNAFEAAGLAFVVLKGFSHASAFVASPSLRRQGDMDLLFRRDQVSAALDIARQLGYQAVPDGDRHPVDHLPTMIRKTGWEWRGDFFDPEMPPALELHFQLWNPGTEGFAVPGVEDFWARRQRRSVEDVEFTSLAAIDLPAYACAHALRHFLRGDLSPSNIYEIAWFLEHNVDLEFWRIWRGCHGNALRRVQAICFTLAQQWFGCGLPAIAEEETRQLAEGVRAWLATYGRTPAVLFGAAKNELWLHLMLLDSSYSRRAILRRRLLPLQFPKRAGVVHLPDEAIGWRVRWRAGRRYLRYLSSRIGRHTRALVPTLLSGGRWWLGRFDEDGQFQLFFLASACFNFGLFIFFLLFNLYLLKLGFDESFLGWLRGAMLAGSVVGSWPAGIVIHRLGLRVSLIACLSTIPGMAAIMAAKLPAPLLLVCAFLYGAVSVMWAVLLSPAVAALTSARTRSTGFSIICSSGIAIGILGGAVGGRLPGWIVRLAPAMAVATQYRIALWIGCAIVLVGLAPACKLRPRAAASPVRRDRRRPPPEAIYFLAAAAIWNVGTGFFNPFFSVFFERLHMSVDHIGLVFSLSQVAQASAILAAPLVFRATGLIRGISRMQLVTAAALVAIAASGGAGTAALAYGGYMVAQNMSEPGMLTYLMDCVPEAERSVLSSWNFLVASCAQAIAAVVSGMLLRRFGYSPVLILAAALCAISGLLVRWLLASLSRVAVEARAC
jgi:MFS family permease